MSKLNEGSIELKIYAHKGNIGSIIHDLNIIMKQSEEELVINKDGTLSLHIDKHIENIDHLMNNIMNKCEKLKEEAKNLL